MSTQSDTQETRPKRARTQRKNLINLRLVLARFGRVSCVSDWVDILAEKVLTSHPMTGDTTYEEKWKGILETAFPLTALWQ